MAAIDPDSMDYMILISDSGTTRWGSDWGRTHSTIPRMRLLLRRTSAGNWAHASHSARTCEVVEIDSQMYISQPKVPRLLHCQFLARLFFEDKMSRRGSRRGSDF